MSEMYAVVIGVSKYKQPGWNHPSACEAAIKVANGLTKVGVKTKNLFFITDTDPHEKEVEVKLDHKIEYESAELITGDYVRRLLKERLPTKFDRQPKSTLLFYWSGHGGANDDYGRFLFCGDYDSESSRDRIVSISSILQVLKNQDYKCYERQYLFFQSCTKIYGQQEVIGAISIDPTLHPAFSHQTVFYASAYGKLSAGEFTKKLTELMDDESVNTLEELSSNLYQSPRFIDVQ